MPVPCGEKGPVISGWQNLNLSEVDVDRLFNAPPGQAQNNIGVILGHDGLVDVDIDDPMALAAADALGLVSPLMWGRPSNKTSHRLFRLPHDFDGRALYGDPLDRKEGTLVELRGKGHQSICWGVHPSGERYAFDSEGEPQPTTLSQLKNEAAKVAACALLAKYYPPSGSRHDALGALIGALARTGYENTEIDRFVRAVVTVAGDPDIGDRVGWIEHTLVKLERTSRVTGWPTLAKILPEPVVDRVKEWLSNRESPLEDEVESKGPAASRMRTAAQLLGMKFPPADPLLPGLDAKDIALIVGPPSSFKSFLALDLALSLATGEPVLNEWARGVRRVCLLSEEDSPEITRDRILRWCEGRKVNPEKVGDNLLIDSKEGFYFGNEEEVSAMVSRLDKFKPELVIVDSIHQTSGIENFADAAEVRAFFRGKVEPMAKRWGCGVVLIHHTNKAVYQIIETVKDAGKVAGSLEFVSTPSAVLFVQQAGVNQNYRRVKSVKFRRGKVPDVWGFVINDIQRAGKEPHEWPYRLEFMDKAALEQERHAEEPESFDDDSLPYRVEATMRQIGAPVELKRLVELVGRPRQSVSRAILQLEKAGRVVGVRVKGSPTLWSLAGVRQGDPEVE